MDECEIGKEGILKTRIWREKEEDEEKLKPLKALCNASMQHCVSATETDTQNVKFKCHLSQIR
jgi:hypothetical protein